MNPHAELPFINYFLAGTRVDSNGLMTYEVWAKRKMTEEQIDENVAAWIPLVHKEYPTSKGPFKIWIDDIYFDENKKDA